MDLSRGQRPLLLFFEQLLALRLVFVLAEGPGVAGFLEVAELLAERGGVIARLAQVAIAHRDDATRQGEGKESQCEE